VTRAPGVIDFDAPKYANTNGIKMAYFEAGEGPTVLLLHGFPDLPYSWRHLVNPIVAAGFRVVVPAQRGYPGTDAPESIDAYTIKTLVADITGLLDVLGVDKAIWIGHDWGGFFAWYAAHYAPERVVGIGSLADAYPLLGAGDLDFVEGYDVHFGPENYVRGFQEPGVAEAVLERDVERTFRAVLRGRGYSREEFEAAPREVFSLPLSLWVGEPQLFGDPIVDDDEIAYYVRAFEKSGFTGALNWYRAMPADHREAQAHGITDYTIDFPALMIAVPDDFFTVKDAAAHMPALIPRLELRVVEGSAHWVQVEKPAEVESIVISWLQKNFVVGPDRTS
jgi:pimeloyl-ACP methyl ester carboxylesterase